MALISGSIFLNTRNPQIILFHVFPYRSVEENNIRISFKTSSKANGLILWYGQAARASPDFLLLGLRSGFLETQFELGSGLAEGRTKQKYNDGG